MKQTITEERLNARRRATVASLLAGVCLLTATAPARSASLPGNYSYGTGFNNQRSMARLSDGTLVLMYQKAGLASSGNGLVLAVSEDNGASWTQELQVAAINNVFADLVPGPGRSIYAVYSTNEDGPGSALDARFAKVEYNAGTGTWVVTGSAFIVDAGATNGAFNAVVAREGNLLWSAVRYYEGGNYSTRLYMSADGGGTWSYTLEADAPGPSGDETAVLVPTGSKLALVYYYQNSQFRCRMRDLGAPAGSWSASQIIHQMADPLGSKSGYSVLADNAGQLHLAFGDGGVKHIRTVGGIWGTPTSVSAAGHAPTLTTDGMNLWGVWEEPVGIDQNLLVMQRFDGAAGIWGSARTYFNHSCERLPAAAWCYSSVGGTWSDVTIGAANTTGNDVVNATTLKTVQDPGDALYVGMPTPFSHLYMSMGTAGSGGNAVWEYWSGSAWTAFVPASGPYTCGASKDLRLWPVIGQGPADWASVSVNGSAPLYYVRTTATVAFTTAPRATQVTSYERNRYAKLVARDPVGLTLAWTRGTAAPFSIETRGTLPWSEIGGGTPVSVGDGPLPASALGQNRPNPFNPRTTIRFSLAAAGSVRLTVYDVRGRSVATLADGAYSAGAHDVVWDGRTREGAAAGSGVYWYRLEADGAQATRRMILLP